MTEIDWDRLPSAELFEDMVAVMLSHRNPQLRRIDGSGGDGGRDVAFPTEAGPEIFQLKSFTGRMTSGRRRQVKASLEKAAQLGPVAWHLVVPIDATPAEGEWFDSLQAAHPFPMSWEGRTWLNGQMAERPFIHRYFLEGESEHVVELLTQMAQEKAVVSDLRVGMERLGALAERINEIDPYYRFDVAVREKTVEVVVLPRYEGAELDHPMTIDVGFAFPGTEEGRRAAAEFQASMDFGSPVTVEGQYIKSVQIGGPTGFGGIFPEGGSLSIGPPQPTDDWIMGVELCVIDPDGVSVARLPITLTERTVGRKGFVAKGSDSSHALAISMQADMEAHQAHLSFKLSPTADLLPQDLLPAFTFMRATMSPNRVQILLGDDHVPMGESIEVPTLGIIEEGHVKLVDHMARLQRETGTYFPMPAEFSEDDLMELSEAIQLLDGGEVVKAWSGASCDLDFAEARVFLDHLVSQPEVGSYFMDGIGEVTIAGHTISLGKMRSHMPEARIANKKEIAEALRAPDVEAESQTIQVILEPAGQKTLKQSLIRGQ